MKYRTNKSNPHENLVSFRMMMLTIALCLFLVASAQAKMLRDVGFEKGWQDFRKNSEKGTFSITSERSRNPGGKSMKIDRIPGSNREELSDSAKGRAQLKKPLEYKWSLFIERNDNDGRLVVSQIHHSQGSNKDEQWLRTGFFLLRCDEDKNPPQFTYRLLYQSGHKQYKERITTLGRCEYGKWYDFRMQAKWTWEKDGYVRIWLNGEQVDDYKGATYSYFGKDTVGPYFKCGAYKGNKKRAIVYCDEYSLEVDPKADGDNGDGDNGDGDLPPPTVELEPAQKASCDRPVMVLEQENGKHLIQCGRGE